MTSKKPDPRRRDEARADDDTPRPAADDRNMPGGTVRISNTEVNDLDELRPDATSGVERSDGEGPVVGTMDRDAGAGAAAGHDAGGPGGREPERRPGVDDGTRRGRDT